MSANPTRALAAWVAGLRASDIPDDVRELVRTMFLDALANGLLGRESDEAATILDEARALYGPGDTTLLSGGTASLAAATMANAYLITAVSACDVHLPTMCHVTPEVVPPLLAVAEQERSAGSLVLTAMAAGLEVTTRVGLGLNYPAFRARGFHAPGVSGPFGGAAAVGVLLGSDVSTITHAFGLATAQAGGTWAQMGSPAIKFQQAHGAVSGLVAGTLAARGFSAAEDGLEAADGGLFSSFSDGGDPDLMLANLGKRWELRNITLRPSPAAAYLQGVVTAIIALQRETPVPAQAIRSVRIGLSSDAWSLHGILEPADRFQARLSARYVAAVTLIDGRASMAQFSAERFADDSLQHFLRERVVAVEDGHVQGAGASVEVTLKDGVVRGLVATVPKGDPADPLTLPEVIAKFRAGAEPSMRTANSDRVVALLDRFESLADASELIRLFR